MNVAFQRNVGSFLRAVAAFGATANITAGGAGDGAPANGLTIDRNTFTPLALSAYVVLQISATLGDAESVDVAISAQDSADGSTWADLDIGPPDDVPATTVSADGVAVVTAKAQLGEARRYVRFRVTPTFSAAATDEIDVLGGVAIIAGFDELPADDASEAGSSS